MMKKLAWTTRWTERRPAISGDEWWRTTLVLPCPVGARTDEDGTDWPALVVVVGPWWLCRDALRPDYRAWIRWHRAATAAQFEVLDDDTAWNLVTAGFERIHPPEHAGL